MKLKVVGNLTHNGRKLSKGDITEIPDSLGEKLLKTGSVILLPETKRQKVGAKHEYGQSQNSEA